MARLKRNGDGRGMTAVLSMVRLSFSTRAFREELRDGLKRRGGTGQGVFREVWLGGAPPNTLEASGFVISPSDGSFGVCAVLPGGLRIEGLDVAGAAALARFLR